MDIRELLVTRDIVMQQVGVLKTSQKRVLLSLASIVFIIQGCDTATAPSQKYSSEEVSSIYSKIAKRYLERGYLKSDASFQDASLTADILARNFELIALHDEYQLRRGRFVASQTPAKVRRWHVPIRMKLHFGASVSARQKSEDIKDILEYTARLERITGHPISLAEDDINFNVFIINAEEQQAAGPMLRETLPGIREAVVRAVTNSPVEILCAAFTLPNARTYEYAQAIVFIKAEHTGIMRRSCIHEEFAQAMGLVSDSREARPSVFNDDEEFAMLTYHDELLLKILYDKRLKTGMSISEARPIVRLIAHELVDEIYVQPIPSEGKQSPARVAQEEASS